MIFYQYLEVNMQDIYGTPVKLGSDLNPTEAVDLDLFLLNIILHFLNKNK